ncbi:ATP-binding protein [Agrococcus sp. KRD186]|uniref:ATP-binding protein n=1 Tax=Agrococcus sp. KRD186 TaxID=2729730 RepID=UPI0019D2AA94|nr:ATP-binding protein [Agrococcus sp. KRD186]
MDPVPDPYTANAGAIPELIVGRDDQLTAFGQLLQRLQRGRTDQSMIITGLRGVGKTVLLSRFAEIAREQSWEVVELEASKYHEDRFRVAIFNQLRSALLRHRATPRRRAVSSPHRSAGRTARPSRPPGW